MVVFSCFDGAACGYMAAKRAYLPISKYIASEIDPSSIQIANKNFPSIIQGGDIRNFLYEDKKLYAYQYDWSESDREVASKMKSKANIEELVVFFLKERNRTELKVLHEGAIDLMIGGSPCQDLSFSGKMAGLYGVTRSALFWSYNRLLKEIRPKHFLLENVKMPKKWQRIITENLNVSPILINSSLVSEQNRERLYWTNIPHPNIKDRNGNLKDILLSDVDDKYFLSEEKIDGMLSEGRISFPKNFNYDDIRGCAQRGRYVIKDGIKKTAQFIEFRSDYKANCLTTVKKDSMVYIGNRAGHFKIRNLHPIEGERLQTLPDNYTKGISENKRWNLIGNGWTVDIISEFLKNIK